MNQAKDRRKNIFVLYLDEGHFQDFEQIPDRDSFNFHGLLDPKDHTRREDYDVNDALTRAEDILHCFDGPIDAIIGYWDFPITAMVSILCEKFSLPSPGLVPVLKCAHKYWSRMEQERYIPEFTPRYCAVNPFSEEPFDSVTLDFPFWIKPVCSYSSLLGFRINNRADFNRAMELARRDIRRIGESFNAILSRVDVTELGGVDGSYMIAEEFVKGIELAPEGYVQQGKVQAHGMVDMVRSANHKSFQAYRYPSSQPRRVQDLCMEAAKKFLQGINYDNGCFNIEFFWDRDTDRIRVVEVNPRVSQSHSKLMEKVDGMSNYEVAIHVGLGDEPQFEHGRGRFNFAAKFLYRLFQQEDALCVSAPGKDDLANLQEQQPETLVSITIKPGERLNDVAEHDSYSWLLAELIIPGDSISDLNRKFDEARKLLPFEFEPVADPAN